jgi:MFS transporter, DHA3 family, macrolide efflux protein
VMEQGAGLRALRARPVVWWAILGSAIPSVLWGLVSISGIPLLAKTGFNNDIRAYSFLVSAYGLGNMISNIVIGSSTIKRRTLVLWAGHLVLALGFVVIGAAPLLPLALLGACLAAMGGPMGDLMLTVLVQEGVPQEHAGKAFAFLYTMWSAATVVGLILATPLYAAFPVRSVMLVASVLAALLSLVGVLRYRKPTPAV